ncbi:MAG: hypothetical protein MZV65_31635 [Chromatiales bacterium]|nr:hypothetical protein [Chromatiales bacterium]
MREHGIFPENARERLKGFEFGHRDLRQMPIAWRRQWFSVTQTGVCDNMNAGLQTVRKYVKCPRLRLGARPGAPR